MSTASAKRNIVFATIPRDYVVLNPAERESKWRQFIELLSLEDFPIHRLYLFINPTGRKYIRLFYAELKKANRGTRISFVPVKTKNDFTVRDIHTSYRFFSGFFSRFTFDAGSFDYYMYFSSGNLFAHAFMLILLINLHNLPLRIVHLRRERDTGERDWFAEVYEGKISRWISEIGQYERNRSDTLDFLKSSIKTGNAAFNGLIRDIEHVALHSSAPILLSGPTGSGKSQLARRIYELRHDRGMVSGHFISVNCATLRGDSALSTLFGHVKGSFTGANQAREGLLRAANNGILFLDEVGELTPDIQVLLLKAIEEKRFMPFGSDREVESNFQLICASNRRLVDDVRTGSFRLDLFSRINLWHFDLPALSERREDIEPNVDYELRRITAEKGLFAEFLPAARRRWLDFAVSDEAVWPSNFRTLAASMERMLTRSFQGVIDEDTVEQEIALLRAKWKRGHPHAVPPERSPEALCGDTRFPLQKELARRGLLPPPEERDLFDAVQLEEVIAVCRASASRSEAGRKLFARSREKKRSADDTARLNKYLKSHGLSWEAVCAAAG
ncbi:MAG: sigma 54-interacting transcriptional regulator [Desulfovibrionaceae bacterium]|nr:sigma 54-interacting transcriptional regulator [Desulfovibrionaceae bacterium]